MEEINIKKKKKDRNPNTEKKTEPAAQGLEVSQSLKTRAQSLGLGWGELVALLTLSSKALDSSRHVDGPGMAPGRGQNL